MTHLFDTNPPGRHFVVTREAEATSGIEDIVQNGDFESGGTLWGIIGNEHALTFETENPIAGERSLRTTTVGGNFTTLLQSKSNQPFTSVIDGDGNVKASAIARFKGVEGEVFLFKATGEDFLNERVAVGFYEWDHRGELIDATFVLTFQDSNLPPNTGNVRTRLGFYRVPAGVFEVTPFIFASSPAADPSGAIFDAFSIRKYGSNDNRLINADFEEGGKYWSPNGAGVSIEETNPVLGSRSLKITSSTTANVAANFVLNTANLQAGLSPTPIPVKAGQIFRVQSTGRGQEDHIISTRVQPVDENGLLVGFSSEVVSLHTGVETTTDFGYYTVPEGVEFVRVSALVAVDDSGPRDFYIDEIDFRLVESTITERLDETKFIDGYWMSPQLNRGGTLTHRFVKLFLQYACEESTTIGVDFTPDGGRNWRKIQTVRLQSTGESIQQVLVNAQVTGHDIRFRLHFNAKLVSIFGYSAETYPANELTRVGD